MNKGIRKYRNWPKRIYIKDVSYFVTFYTKNRYPYFKETILCDLFLENLKECKKLKEFLLFGWVIVYEHIHLLIQPDGKWNISEIMHSLKRHTSRNINYVLGYYKSLPHPSVSRDGHPDLQGRNTGSVCHPDLQGRNTGSVCHPDLQGRNTGSVCHPDLRGMDALVKDCRQLFMFDRKSKNMIPKFQWQQSFYDRYMRNETEFHNVLDYLEYNPDKHGLPSDWTYVYTNPKYENLTDDIL